MAREDVNPGLSGGLTSGGAEPKVLDAEVYTEFRARGLVGRERVPVYVWDRVVRWAHWINAISIFVLAGTGLYIARPFSISGAGFELPADSYVMGTFRLVHFLAGYVLAISVLARTYWSFRPGSPTWISWSRYLPISAESRKSILPALKTYIWPREVEPLELVGHTGLANLSYSILWVALYLQILTGFALFSTSYTGGVWPFLFGWLVKWWGPNLVRLVHHLLMWFFIAFFIHHMFAAAFWESRARKGTWGSIFTGWKYL